MINLADEHNKWLWRHRGLVLSFLEVGERVFEPTWAKPPWLVLWPVVGKQRRWMLIGTFSDTRETAIAIA